MSIEPMTATTSASSRPLHMVSSACRVAKLGVAHVHAVRLGGAVGDDVVAHLAARRLDRLVDLAGGNGEAFGHDLEVMDERLHLRLHLFAVGQDDLGRVGDDAARRACRRSACWQIFTDSRISCMRTT